jgi:hypothetical protein
MLASPIKPHWDSIPTKRNQADLLTRPTDIETFAKCDLWWQGPKEVFTYDIPIAIGTVIDVALIELISSMISRFSSYKKVMKVTEVVLKFINFFKLLYSGINISKKKKGEE